MSEKMCAESENQNFSHIFFQHGYLTYYSSYVFENLDAYSLDLFGGKVAQNFDIGLSFGLIVCRRWNLEKKYKKLQKLPVFCHKIKTKAYTKNLR